MQWQGTILDVQGTTVLIAMGDNTGDKIIGSDLESAAKRLIAKERGMLGQDVVQVLLHLNEQAAGHAAELTKGRRLDYSGTLSEIGDPYPYVIIDGSF